MEKERGGGWGILDLSTREAIKHLNRQRHGGRRELLIPRPGGAVARVRLTRIEICWPSGATLVVRLYARSKGEAESLVIEAIRKEYAEVEIR